MKSMVSMDEFGMQEYEGKIVVSSRYVANAFGEAHLDVLEKIKINIENAQDFAEEFSAINFIEHKYKCMGKYYPEYLLTKNGFNLLAIGFTGEKSLKSKVDYINLFNEMEDFREARMYFPALIDAITSAHSEPNIYHFSNEVNMINKIVLGMTTKEFQAKHGIDKETASIRPYLTNDQINAIESLEMIDIGLLVGVPDFQQRKAVLQQQFILLTARMALKLS